jgi:2-phospho-L-lactate guanylyltransferase
MSGADLAHVVAVVPVSSLSEAKSRLGEPLDPEERAALVLGLLRRTVMAGRAAGRVTGVVVVSKDQALLAAGRAIGAATVAQGEGDLNAGLAAARASIGPAASAILVLPPDLPRVSAGEIDRLIEAGERAHSRAPAGPLVVLVPDQHGSGTNALLVSPPDAIPFRFGEASRAAHAAEAAAAGATYLEVGGPLAFDVDTAEDLLAADLSGLGHEAGR